MQEDPNAQDNTNVTPTEGVDTPVVESTADVEPTVPTAGDVIEPTEDTPSEEVLATVEEDVEPTDTVEEVAVPENEPCAPCRGTGLKDGASDATETCSSCKGSGIVSTEE